MDRLADRHLGLWSFVRLPPDCGIVTEAVGYDRCGRPDCIVDVKRCGVVIRFGCHALQVCFRVGRVVPSVTGWRPAAWRRLRRDRWPMARISSSRRVSPRDLWARCCRPRAGSPVAHGLRFGLGQCTAKQSSIWLQAGGAGDEGGGHPGLRRAQRKESKGRSGETAVLPASGSGPLPGRVPGDEALEGGNVASSVLVMKQVWRNRLDPCREGALGGSGQTLPDA